MTLWEFFGVDPEDRGEDIRDRHVLLDKLASLPTCPAARPYGVNMCPRCRECWERVIDAVKEVRM